jgi:L-iditol 2-dehydrogenase
MKHVHARATELIHSGRVDVASLVSHRFPLTQAPEAFAMNASYSGDVVKVVIDS